VLEHIGCVARGLDAKERLFLVLPDRCAEDCEFAVDAEIRLLAEFAPCRLLECLPGLDASWLAKTRSSRLSRCHLTT